MGDFFADAASDTWPFTRAEIAGIAKDYSLDERAVSKLVNAGRDFVLRQFLRDNTKPPHARHELLRLKAASIKFRKAIDEMGTQARGHLENHRQPAIRGPDFTLTEIEHALWGFSHANRAAFETLPSAPRGGAPNKKHETRYYTILHRLWEAANSGQKKKYPFKRFRSACVRPLKRYGSRPLAEKGEYDKTRPRRRAAQSE